MLLVAVVKSAQTEAAGSLVYHHYAQSERSFGDIFDPFNRTNEDGFHGKCCCGKGFAYRYNKAKGFVSPC